MQLLNRYLTNDMCNAITGTFPPGEDAGEDQCYWRPTTSRPFTIKSVYNISNNSQWNPQNNKWSLAWSFLGPQRIRTLLWLVLNNALLTNSQRFHMHINSDPWCPSCCGTMETWGHILRDCFQAKAIWTDLLPSTLSDSFWNRDVEAWLQNNLNNSSIDAQGIMWKLTFGIAYWMLWKARNRRVFENNRIPRLSSKIRLLAEHYHKYLELLC